MIKVGIVASTIVKLSNDTKKGTEIFVHKLASKLLERKKDLNVTIFASKDSQIENLQSIQKIASLEDKDIKLKYSQLFDLANIANAFNTPDIDIFHVNITNGELILPFAQFIKKPILITTHYHLSKNYRKKLFGYYHKLDNVYYISVSDSQRTPLPNLNYVKTIYHGIDLKTFKFNSNPTTSEIIWAGRGVPEKGLGDVIQVIKLTGHNAKIFPILKSAHVEWMINDFLKIRNSLKSNITVRTNFDIDHRQLANHYQHAKLFLNPIKWEEPFGLVMIEAMACGTPVVAYARGSVPEIVKDGKTGFIVNSSEKDKRGNWIIKKTGVAGLIEAVERIYALPETKYRLMRLNCRKHVEKHFAIERMVDEYIETYKQVIADYKTRRENKIIQSNPQ